MQTCSYVPGCDYVAQDYATADFDYDLAQSQIAQTPVAVRDRCRLLVLDRDTGQIKHRTFSDIVDYLESDDLLVVNETRVLPARILARRFKSGGMVELLLLRRVEEEGKDTQGNTKSRVQHWCCLVKPGKNAPIDQELEICDRAGGVVLTATVCERAEGGTRIIELRATRGTVDEAVHRVGKVPLPPYITQEIDDRELYQTVYSQSEHSAAAPTAGLHFTKDLLERIRQNDVRIETIRLDVGLDTFRPVKVDNPVEHHIHTEYIQVEQRTVDEIARTRARKGRVIAVGTTTARALETAYQATPHGRSLEPFAGTSGLFIVPGYRFGIVDALVTNFHVPRSTLMMMVSAFASRNRIMDAYRVALDSGYRFLSFGDAMLIQ